MIKKVNVISNFISIEEKNQIVDLVNSYQGERFFTDNVHLDTIIKSFKGKSLSYDFSKTSSSNYISLFQGFVIPEIDPVFEQIRDRICSTLNLSKEHSFLQILSSEKEGKINSHYDASIDGYVNFKCNICIESEIYKFYIDTFEPLEIQERTLYTFEASLFKHWTNPFTSKRIVLSYGFLIPYEELKLTKSDPRVRLSNRIIRHLQNKIK